MSRQSASRLEIAPALRTRLTELAAREGQSLEAFAESVLLHYADAAEQQANEFADDDERWQRYLATGLTIPHPEIRRKLHSLAARAAAAETPR